MMRWSTGGIIAVLCLISTFRAVPLPLADDENDPSRLPRNSRILRYDIDMNTDIHTCERDFDGVVIIYIEITADTDTITLNNRGLTPITSRLYDNGVDDIPHNFTSDTSREFFVITSIERVLHAGELYTIEITYSGHQLQYALFDKANGKEETTFVNRIIQNEQNQMILPKTSEPKHYKIHITATNIPSGGRDFSGEIEIDALVKQTTDRIVVHSRKQIILDVQVFYKNDMTSIPVHDYIAFPAAHILTIYFVSEIPANSDIIAHIKYSGIMQTTQTSHGFYITSYTHEGETRYLGVTQFESSLGSRFAFPHYDEPRFKATFELTLTHSNLHHAISNTFGTAVNNEDGTVTTTFEVTPNMSSYLLAFVISDLESITNELAKEENETLHRIWVRPDSVSKGWFALESADRSLKALENYLNFKFALPKMDSVGIPNTGGGMENWGMITYEESTMIQQENYEDIPHMLKFLGVRYIMHEQAHQFFGNAVTFEWWDYLWLSEGFATLMSYDVTGILYPEWRTTHFFNIRVLHNAFRYDSNSRRSMTPTPSLLTPLEISAAFDPIAYDKSESVIRMFQNALGEEMFKAALNLYLKDNEYKSAIPQNLFDAFQTVMDNAQFSDFDFATAFKTWELQSGYPVIHVSYCDTRQFEITQRRFFTQRNQSIGDTSSWYIPLNFATASDPNFDEITITEYFVNEQERFWVNVSTQFDDSQWFVFNKQQLGYYRVNYDLQNWNAVSLVLNSKNYNQIHVLNRVQLIDDSLRFAEGDYLGYDVLLNILPYLRRESEYTPWYAADQFISTLYTAFGPHNDDLNAFVRALSEHFYDIFKVPDDGYIPFEEVYERFSRELALKFACSSGNERCLSDTFHVNRRFIDDNHPIPKGLEDVILCNGLRGIGKETQWSELWRISQTTTDSTFKSQTISALGCTDDPLILKDYLESTLAGGTNYTETERQNVLGAVLYSQSGLSAVIDFIRDFQFDILRLFGYPSLEDVLYVPARRIKTRNDETMFLNFVQTLSLEATNSSRIIAIVNDNFQVQQQIRYVESMEFIRRYLNDGQEPTPEQSTTEQPTTEPTSAVVSTLKSLRFTALFTSLFIVFTLNM